MTFIFAATSRFSESSSAIVFGSLAALIGLAWLAVFLYDRVSNQASKTQTETLTVWDQLCVAHKLNLAEQQILEQIQLMEGHSAVAPFVDPRILKACEADAEDKTAVQSLGQKLFGELYIHQGPPGELVGKFPQLTAAVASK